MIFIVHCKSVKIVSTLIETPQGDIIKGGGVGGQSLGVWICSLFISLENLFY